MTISNQLHSITSTTTTTTTTTTSTHSNFNSTIQTSSPCKQHNTKPLRLIPQLSLQTLMQKRTVLLPPFLLLILLILLTFTTFAVFANAQQSQASSPTSPLSAVPFTGTASVGVVHDPMPSPVTAELHHSLHPPLDQSQIYWNFGGSTVLTKQAIRLTPAAQDRRGWLWNDYPLESENFEMEFSLQVQSKPHLGGDGFGVWFVHSKHDPTYGPRKNGLPGDLFGFKKDLSATGVLFDVYDNDMKRNNPVVFVLHNPEGTDITYNHDNDYQDNMYKRVASNSKDYHCVAGVRNTKLPSKVLIKFVRKQLYVFIDTEDGVGYKFCLGVEFDKSFKDHHIAFSAMTGQVADAHDILELSTRYLPSDTKINDEAFAKTMTDRSRSTKQLLFWTVINVGGLALIGFTASQLRSFKSMKSADINAVVVCQEVNATIVPHYVGHLLLSAALLVLLFDWIGFALNVPLCIWRLYQFIRKSYQLTPVQLDSEKSHNGGISFTTKLMIAESFYVIAQIYYIYRWLSC